jgi:hypothetical protein
MSRFKIKSLECLEEPAALLFVHWLKSSIPPDSSEVMNWILKIKNNQMPSSAMEDASRRAKKDKKDRKRRASLSSSSSDSDSSSKGSTTVETHVKKRSKNDVSHLTKQLAQHQDDEAAILKRIAEQKAKNEKIMQELAEARNNYPVFYVSPQIQLAFDFFVLADGCRKARNAIAAFGDIDVRPVKSPVRKAAQKYDYGCLQRNPCPMADC